MATRVRDFDWSRTPLGPIEQWPRTLVAAANLCLNSRLPMVLYWGPEWITIYNDAASGPMGPSKHPRGLGRSVQDVWPELATDVLPVFQTILESGEGIAAQNVRYVVDRNGYSEETFFSNSFSAVFDEDCQPSGILVTFRETTEQVIALRRSQIIQALSAAVRQADAAEDVYARAFQALSENREDVPFGAVYNIRGEAAQLERSFGGEIEFPREVQLDDADSPVAVCARLKELQYASGIRAAVLPIQEPGRDEAVAVLVLGRSPRREFDDAYRAFMAEVGSRISAAISAADAREQEGIKRKALAELHEADARHRAELAARVAEFETLFREIPISVGIARDPDCEYIRLNPAFAQLLGISENENGSKSTDPNLPFRVMQNGREIPAEEMPMQIAARTGREVRDFEYDLVREDGTHAVEYGHAVPLFDASGKPAGSIAVFVDITERKRAQLELLRANEDLTRLNEDLRQFAYSASHDLREPLRTVSIYGELLKLRLGAVSDPEAKKYIDFVTQATSRMEQLLSDLLAYTQASSENLDAAETDANDALVSALDALKVSIAEAGAEVIPHVLPRVRMGATHLQQIFQNLIGNAIKYRDAGRPSRVEIRAEAFLDGWRFSVADNGIGIPRQYQEQIFGLFKRLHATGYSGTGIGLAITQRLVTRYGGRIWVESEPGSGSTFYFTVPTTAHVTAH
jgi:PAS domain S-box-containing protein